MKQGRRLALAATAALLLGASGAPEYDLVLRGGRVLDGSGNPWYAADIGIRAGKVAAVGRLAEATAARTLDAAGLVVAPGFIDVHAHVETGLRERRTADNFLLDGVTTLVTGNCGGSEVDLPRFFDELRAGGLSLNLASLIGHNSVRRAAMGTEERDPTADELARMEALVDQAMRAGAVGLSTGLIYVPGTYAKTPEVVALARVAARHGGVYASHIRSEGDQVFAAIDEAVEVGRQAGLPVQISHFKVSNKNLWGQSVRTIAQVDRARAAGLDVTVDQYPYAASSTGLSTLLPSWALAGGGDALRARLADRATRDRVAREMKDHIRRRNGRKRLDYAVVASCSWDRTRDGLSLSAINERLGRPRRLEHEIETVLEMMEKGGAQMVYHAMDEQDVERILRVPYAMVASDAGVVEPGMGRPHPRAYGTNARVLGRYVRERGALRLEEAVRKMTSLPAQRFGLVDRGLVRPGLWADLVVFDPAAVADRATFEAPHAPPAGFRFVLVNGEVVVEDGRHLGTRPGQVLRRAPAGEITTPLPAATGRRSPGTAPPAPPGASNERASTAVPSRSPRAEPRTP
jgi:N-acyl-D-amino-acid deacylase